MWKAVRLVQDCHFSPIPAKENLTLTGNFVLRNKWVILVYMIYLSTV